MSNLAPSALHRIMQPRQHSQQAEGPVERWVSSICGLCSLGCGLEIAVGDGRIRGVRGRLDHPVGLGRLGPKGLAQWHASHHPSRGTVPQVRNPAGQLQTASWDEAMALVAEKIKDAVQREGPGGVAFYNSGQLLLEEYYTLGKIARGGIGTPNIDANTRLCTATVGESLMESFGADGPPGAFEDFEQTECIVLFGHNVAEQSTVLWMRIMAAKDGPLKPKIIVIDPRRTLTAAGSDLHLAPKPGTNVAVINGICQQLIEHGWIDRSFIDAHTSDFPKFASTVAPYTPTEVERIAGVPQANLRQAAEWIGRSRSTITTCLQGVYQSHQATATACTVNSMHLLMGKIGKPGSAPFQFAGQPSSMNTRETGANGAYPGYRNWDNPDHMQDLANRWNVPVEMLGKKPVSAPEIFELCAQGDIKVLLCIGTNPAVSLPDRMNQLKTLGSVFLVVLDPFADTETVAFADVYLPTAMWGEKTGCMTNAERRCSLLQKAVEPPGQARPDFEIFVDLSRRLDLKDKEGQPLITFETPQAAFEEWKRISKGRIPDYSGMTYEAMLAKGGLQWPCTESAPNGTVRLYREPVFPTAPAITESFLKDLDTGQAHSKAAYAQLASPGKARLRAEAYSAPVETCEDAFPLQAITGRQVYHWHTRTKTRKAPELAAAAPGVFVELNSADALALGVVDGDMVKVIARRGSMCGPAKVGNIAPPGVVFVPFHYGDLDKEEAANLLTPRISDPASKQPVQKLAAVRVEKTSQPPAAWWKS